MVLGWHNFTIDHVDPHSKGGRSTLDNAALMCGPCKSAKGNRRKPHRATRQTSTAHVRGRRTARKTRSA